MVVKKSVRTKHRYLLLSVSSKVALSEQQLIRELHHLSEKYLGLINYPNLKLVAYDGKKAIVRCDWSSFMNVRAMLALATFDDFRLKLLKSSGTISSLQ